jgi:hypothetical protein
VDDDKEMDVKMQIQKISTNKHYQGLKNTFDVVYNKQWTKLDLTLHTK